MLRRRLAGAGTPVDGPQPPVVSPMPCDIRCLRWRATGAYSCTDPEGPEDSAWKVGTPLILAVSFGRQLSQGLR